MPLCLRELLCRTAVREGTVALSLSQDLGPGLEQRVQTSCTWPFSDLVKQGPSSSISCSPETCTAGDRNRDRRVNWPPMPHQRDMEPLGQHLTPVPRRQR